jgi:hypothetical protein
MKVLLLILGALVCVVPTGAQSMQPCSDFSIEAVEKADPGTPIVVSARPNTGSISLTGLRFNWSVSVGTIMAGQGTSRIAFDTSWLGGQRITATVEVVGNQTHCSTSKTVEINPPRLPECPFDSYGEIKRENEQARLDNFAIQLQNQPTARGALITFAGNPTYKGEATYKLRRATDYLVNVRDIARERLITVEAGYATNLTTYLYIVPEGASLPSQLAPSLPLSQVRFTKPKPNLNRKSTSRRCSN